jgi:2-dehydro-3-deoxygalactonokinase
MMHGWHDGFIAVDWGTTNRRAYRLDPAGTVTAEMEDEAGVTAVPSGNFAAAVAQITDRLGDWPLLLAGMIGSNRGWHEAPYLPCPVTLPELARNLLWVDERRTAIVPGVCLTGSGRADVMRGEEVQVFGHAALAQNQGGRGGEREDALVCHPGTHTKWVRMSGGAIADFRTFMTGELFALLRDHSILAPLLHGGTEPDADFMAGAAVGLAGPELAAELFSARARVLLGQVDPASVAAWISGLLIGADVSGGLAFCGPRRPRTVTVLGRPSLNRLYLAALAQAGVTAVGADGRGAFIAGMQAIRKAL